VDLGDIVTKATLADAFKLALSRTGYALVKTKGSATQPTGAPVLTR
jgi:hypothetical protein